MVALGLLWTLIASAQDPGVVDADDWTEPPLPGLDDGEDPELIINGELGNAREWRAAGGLVAEATLTIPGYGGVRTRMLLCSATLIAPDVVLTAAHCVDVDGLTAQGQKQGVDVAQFEDLDLLFVPAVDLTAHQFEFDVYGGFSDLPASAVYATEWTKHEDFDLAGIELGLHRNADIALVFLEEAVDREFVLLPTYEEAAELAPDDPVVIVGWGQQSQDGIAGTKQVADSYISKIGKWEMKIGELPEDGRKCHGDSGGPTFREFDGFDPWRIIGVTSHTWDASDCRETGGVDTRVDAYLPWIDARMRLACAQGVRPWCLTEGIIAPPDSAGLYSWEQDLGKGGLRIGNGEGCGCAAGPTPPGLLLLGILPWLIRRRSHRDRALAKA